MRKSHIWMFFIPALFWGLPGPANACELATGEGRGLAHFDDGGDWLFPEIPTRGLFPSNRSPGVRIFQEAQSVETSDGEISAIVGESGGVFGRLEVGGPSLYLGQVSGDSIYDRENHRIGRRRSEVRCTSLQMAAGLLLLLKERQAKLRSERKTAEKRLDVGARKKPAAILLHVLPAQTTRPD